MSAYELYASTTTDSPVLSQSAWLKSLKGDPGKDGKDGAPGAPGADGKRGPTGMSAYDVYVANTTDNPVLSQHDWLQSLKGDIGPTGADGKRGQTGMSAYDVYLSTTTDSPVLSQNDWLKSLKGDPGPTGADGKRGPTGMSAYDLYASTTTDNPVLSQSAWLKSLQGPPGPQGADGKKGPQGDPGPQGPAGDITGATPTTICVVNSGKISLTRDGCSLHWTSQHCRLRPDPNLVIHPICGKGLRPALERASIVSGFTRGVEHGDEVLGVVERRQGSEHLFRTAYHTERKS